MTDPEAHVTFERAMRLDPRIGALLRAAKAQRPAADGHYCANRAWHDTFKPQVLRRVGKDALPDGDLLPADRRFLRSVRVYDVVYEVLYGALPCCRRCRCA